MSLTQSSSSTQLLHFHHSSSDDFESLQYVNDVSDSHEIPDHEYATFEPFTYQYFDHEYATVELSNSLDHGYASISSTDSKEQTEISKEPKELKAFVKKKKNNSIVVLEPQSCVTKGDFPTREPGESLLKCAPPHKAKDVEKPINTQKIIDSKSGISGKTREETIEESKFVLSITFPLPEVSQDVKTNEAKNATRSVLSPIGNKPVDFLACTLPKPEQTPREAFCGDENTLHVNYLMNEEAQLLGSTDDNAMHTTVTGASESQDHNYSHVTSNPDTIGMCADDRLGQVGEQELTYVQLHTHITPDHAKLDQEQIGAAKMQTSSQQRISSETDKIIISQPSLSNLENIQRTNQRMVTNQKEDILQRIESLIHDNKNKLEIELREISEIKKADVDPVKASEMRKSSLQRIEDLLKQNEDSVSQTANYASLLPQAKPTLSDKIKQVKETAIASYPVIKNTADEIAKISSNAVQRIEHLIAQNEKNIEHRKSEQSIEKETAPNIDEDALDRREIAETLQTHANSYEKVEESSILKKTVCEKPSQIVSRKRSWSFSQGEKVKVTREIDPRAMLAVESLLVMHKAGRDSVHDHAYSNHSTKHLKLASKPKPEALHMNETSAQNSKSKPSLKSGKLKSSASISSYTAISLEEVGHNTSPYGAQSTAASQGSVSSLSPSRAIIRDHTYEEDQVNTQQFSILRDHSYKKLKKGKRSKQSKVKETGSLDHSYTPKP